MTGDLYIAPVPQCPEHGRMKSRTGDIGNGYTGTIWVCPGWDGEGCDYRAPPPEWRKIGVTDGPVRLNRGLHRG
jgi:hypothetical protein